MKNVLNKAILAVLATVFVSIGMTASVKAAGAAMGATPLYPTPSYMDMINIQAQELARQQQYVLSGQDVALVQQQQYALQAYQAGLVQQQQQLLAQAQTAANSQIFLSQQQEIQAARQTYNDARYMQQLARMQAAYVNALQAEQRLNFENLMANQKIDYRNVMVDNFTQEQWDTLNRVWGIVR